MIFIKYLLTIISENMSKKKMQILQGICILLMNHDNSDDD